MAMRIVAKGRARAGKSSFAILVSRYLTLQTLLIDLDSDLGLADMLGLYLGKEGYKLQK